MNKDKECDYKDCDSVATKSIRTTVEQEHIDREYCVGHYWTVATNHYGAY
jgi:hypothetical protein